MINSELMQAAIYKNYGSPEVLKISSIPLPGYKDDEVLINIRASTVNRTDCGFLRAKPFIVRFFSGLLRPKNQILGCEFAGQVVAVGRAVTDFAIGDRVFGFKDDDHGFGGHAQFTAMPTSAMIATIPDGVSYHQAAPALEGAHYALHYIRASQISSGDSVLVNGATGAIGSAAVQIIHELGATITAVCGADDLELVRSLGADKVIDYQSQDFTKLNEKFDVVFDAVGKSTYGRCKNILREKGVYASTELGPYIQNPFLAMFTARSKKKRVLFPLPANKKEDALELRSLIERNCYTPLIDKTYSLDQITAAFHYVETGTKKGNVIITIDPVEHT